MVLYGITLVPLAQELRAADSGLLSPFYVDDVAFDGSARRSAQLLKLPMERGPDRGISPNRPSQFLSWTHRDRRKQRSGNFRWRG